MTFKECFNDISPEQILYVNVSNNEQRSHFNMRILKCMKHNWGFISSSRIYDLIISKLVLLKVV